MSNLHNLKNPTSKYHPSKECMLESEMMSIRWQLRFLAEAIPEWVRCGVGASDDAAAGIGNMLNKIADQVEAVAEA